MIPLSEEVITKEREKIVIKAGDIFERTLGIDLSAGEKQEVFFDLELQNKSEAEISIFVRGEGEFLLHRTVNVLGDDAIVRFRIFGETRKKSNVSLADDVIVHGKRSNVELRTRFVLRDEARSHARQRIVLMPSAHAAIATQKIDHLLLGEGTEAEGIPELDVRLDDVTCSHGATTSRPSEDAMFYLLSRGLSQEAAEKTFVHGFLGV